AAQGEDFAGRRGYARQTVGTIVAVLSNIADAGDEAGLLQQVALVIIVVSGTAFGIRAFAQAANAFVATSGTVPGVAEVFSGSSRIGDGSEAVEGIIAVTNRVGVAGLEGTGISDGLDVAGFVIGAVGSATVGADFPGGVAQGVEGVDGGE
ncbi:hypothetical protein EDC63_1561, partial [Sulfurirhabdus autotrophica]